jgi:aryl-alcohol dehydrogenase-like predicted oxidoreductase
MNEKIELRKLGHTGMMVTPVGLGCWQFSKQKNLAGKFWADLDDYSIRKIVSLALEGGINWFDTAELYGNGESEKALSDALKTAGKKPGEVFIATKWSPLFRFSSNIHRTINNRINALSPYPIDLYQIHNPYGFSSIKNEVEAMADLLERGLIKSIGVSNFSARQMEVALKALDKRGITLASNQVRYNLLDRKIESNGILESAKKLGITIIAYSPLARGF